MTNIKKYADFMTNIEKYTDSMLNTKTSNII